MSETAKLLKAARFLICEDSPEVCKELTCIYCETVTRIDAHLAKRDVVEVPKAKLKPIAYRSVQIMFDTTEARDEWLRAAKEGEMITCPHTKQPCDSIVCAVEGCTRQLQAPLRAPPIGWRCPSCGCGVAPWQAVCPNCPPSVKVEITGGTS